MSELRVRLGQACEDTTPGSSICTDINVSMCVQAASEQSISLLDVSDVETTKQDANVTHGSTANDRPPTGENVRSFKTELVQRLLKDQEALCSTSENKEDGEKLKDEQMNETGDQEILRENKGTLSDGGPMCDVDITGVLEPVDDVKAEEMKQCNEDMTKIMAEASDKGKAKDVQDSCDDTIVLGVQNTVQEVNPLIDSVGEKIVGLALQSNFNTDPLMGIKIANKILKISSELVHGKDENFNDKYPLDDFYDDFSIMPKVLISDGNSRKRSFDGFSKFKCNIKKPENSTSEPPVYLRIDAATSAGLSAIELAISLAPFIFPWRIPYMFVSMNFAVSLGKCDGSDRIFGKEITPLMELVIPVPLLTRAHLLQYYNGNLPVFYQYVVIEKRRLWDPDYVESRMTFAAVNKPECDLWERIEIPCMRRMTDHGELTSVSQRWMDSFVAGSNALRRHIVDNLRHHSTALEHGICRAESEDQGPFIVELRFQAPGTEPIRDSAFRRFVNALTVPAFIYRKRSSSGFLVYHVISSTLLDAVVLMTRCNKKEAQWCERSQSYHLVPSTTSRVYAKICHPSYLSNHRTKTLNRLVQGSGKKGKHKVVRNSLESLLEKWTTEAQVSLECLKLVKKIGVCEKDQQLVILVLMAALRSLKDRHEVGENENYSSGFSVETGQFMCCMNDVGLIEAVAQFIYCPCSACTPFLYEDVIDDSAPVLRIIQ